MIYEIVKHTEFDIRHWGWPRKPLLDVTHWHSPRTIEDEMKTASYSLYFYWGAVFKAFEALAYARGALHQELKLCPKVIEDLGIYFELLGVYDRVHRRSLLIESLDRAWPSQYWGKAPVFPPEDYERHDGAIFTGWDGKPKMFFNGRRGQWWPMSMMPSWRPIIRKPREIKP